MVPAPREPLHARWAPALAIVDDLEALALGRACVSEGTCLAAASCTDRAVLHRAGALLRRAVPVAAGAGRRTVPVAARTRRRRPCAALAIAKNAEALRARQIGRAHV